MIQEQPQWGQTLIEDAERWRDQIASTGWKRPGGRGPILPLLVGEDQATLDLQQQLERAGVLSIAIRPPTVPEGLSRLRLVLHRGQSDDALMRLLHCLEQARTPT